MKEDNGILTTTTTTGVAWSQQPGSWFYEMGDDNSRGSPTNENADDLAMMRSLLGVRNVTESVEVPSSEHVAEIVGRQGTFENFRGKIPAQLASHFMRFVKNVSQSLN